jgi:hypothetical protein
MHWCRPRPDQLLCPLACAQRERSGGITLQYRITRGLPGASNAGAPPPRMEHFAFAPVETPHGMFRMGVDFAPSSTVTILEQTTNPAPMAQVPRA